MRLEASVPDARGTAVVEFADELGLSRSQLVDEELALFQKVVLEVRRGRRHVTLDPQSTHPACELATPTLAALKWALSSQKVQVPANALSKMRQLAEASPRPSPRLRAAAKRHAR